MLRESFKTGLGFGVTSGVITTLGLMVGIYSGTESSFAVIGGILTIAIADSFSDSLGVHVSKEFENKCTKREIWEATIVTFITKFIIAITFVLPILVFSLKTAVLLSIFWGFLLLTSFSYYMSKVRKINPWYVIAEHLTIGTLVILATHYVGIFIRNTFI